LSLTAEYIHIDISVAVGGSFENRLPWNCSCCWRALWKQTTCTSPFLKGGLLKAKYLPMICFVAYYVSEYYVLHQK